MVNVKGIVTSLLFVIIGIIIATTVMGETVGDVQTAGNTVNATGAPLSGLYAGDGVLPLVLLGAVFLGMMALAFRAAKA